MSVMVSRPLPEFLADVELELRTATVGMTHDRLLVSGGHAPDCRKCCLIRLADEAADRAALLGATV